MNEVIQNERVTTTLAFVEEVAEFSLLAVV